MQLFALPTQFLFQLGNASAEPRFCTVRGRSLRRAAFIALVTMFLRAEPPDDIQEAVAAQHEPPYLFVEIAIVAAAGLLRR
jgi:hypothetical protein